MIVYQSRFLIRGEVWFDNSPSKTPVDWIVYHQRSRPVPKANWRPFYTRVVDLAQTPETLLGQMDGFTAADIRKAHKKDLTVCHRLAANDAKIMNNFCDFYDRFAARRELGRADRYWLSRTAEAGNLDLWAANSSKGERLAFYVLYRERNRVRGVHMASLHAEASGKEAQRKIGRANRLLAWQCMLYYREEGAQIFDLGGWYNGTTDLARLGINKFKESLGGKVVCEYEGEQLLTFKAWSAVRAARLWQRLKDWRASRGQPRPANLPLTPALQ